VLNQQNNFSKKANTISANYFSQTQDLMILGETFTIL